MALETISILISGFLALVICSKLFGVLAGAEGWGFSKSVSAFFTGLVIGLFVGVIFSLNWADGETHLKIMIITGTALISGTYSVHRYWADYYYRIIFIPLLITASLAYLLLRFHFGWLPWWRPLLAAIVLGWFVGWIFWLLHRFIYPYTWVITNALTFSLCSVAIKISLFRIELIRSVVARYQEVAFWRSLPGRMEGEIKMLLIVWAASTLFIAYIWYIQRFKERWRALITDAKTQRANPCGGLIGSAAMAVKGFRQTLSHLFILRRVPENYNTPFPAGIPF